MRIMNERNIWSVKQNHPELVVEDCKTEFGLSEEQCEKLRFILLKRGVNKWLYARRKFIDLKHRVKEYLKNETDIEKKKLIEPIYVEMQHIARLPRWIIWDKKIHKKMRNSEKAIIIKGRHC